MSTAPKMPDAYKGKTTKGGGYTKTAPREWTENEIAWVEDLLDKGFNYKEIAESIERSEVSTSIKIKRLSKKDKSYNAEHVADKYEANRSFIDYIGPCTVLDVYIVITFGELGHKRWKRLDYVSRYYGIESLEEFTLDNLIKHVQMIGRRNKKDLSVFAKREWRNIGRVWFEIKPLKITEQWEINTEANKEAIT